MEKLQIIAASFFVLSCSSGGDERAPNRTRAQHDGHVLDSGSLPIVDTANADNTRYDAEAKITVDHYAGELPCADCEAIETELSLTTDNKYMLHTIYRGRKAKGAGSNEFGEEGTWILHGMDTIHLQGRKDAPSVYIRTDSSLIQLDMKGQRITGRLANRYELKKIGN
jgi:uncharacterized lipoprotein NlpE involved in copper resistance